MDDPFELRLEHQASFHGHPVIQKSHRHKRQLRMDHAFAESCRLLGKRPGNQRALRFTLKFDSMAPTAKIFDIFVQVEIDVLLGS
jgi:hypothetical protein